MKKHLPVTSVVVVIVSIWFLVFDLVSRLQTSLQAGNELTFPEALNVGNVNSFQPYN